MPINYTQVQESLEDYTRKVKNREDQRDEVESTLWQQLEQQSENIEGIKAHLDLAATIAKSLYCAKPVNEPLLFHKAAAKPPQNYTLVAADGSQIAPNRHKALEYCVINVGLISAEMGSGKEPCFEIQSNLLDYDQLITEDGFLIGEQQVSLLRDLSERQALVAFCAGKRKPILTMTDGLLDIYQRLESPDEQQKLQQEVLTLHRQMEAQELITVGYIDKPGSELLGRLFDILGKSDEELTHYNEKQRVIRGVSDARLFKRLLTIPGERSAIFEAFNKSRDKQAPRLEVHFFFLNIGEPGTPYLARVEFPAWVSARPDLVDLLHAVVYADTQVLAGHPYPYLLLRVHELAIINFAEYTDIEAMLIQKFEEEGLNVGQPSHKQHGKDQVGRRNHAK
ncbi:MAG TPA: DNA double-strand break repair nuclease NurA [Anaerolineaceae bacterium]|nr:DNA double-strand break repair nuclease NurA [Anaerolineaceae bacterium]